jgi:hypothetical protein
MTGKISNSRQKSWRPKHSTLFSHANAKRNAMCRILRGGNGRNG